MNSSSSLQRKQLLTKDYPPFWSWSKVKKFPQVVSHAKKSTFEGTREFQTTHIGNDTTTPNSKSAYKWLTENLLLYKFIHTNLYSSSLSITFPCNLKNKSSTSSTTQSFKEHEKQGFQWPLFPCWTQRSATQASFATAKAYKEGKETHNGSSPPRLSIQNFTLLSPTTKEKKKPKKMFCSFLMDFQSLTPYLTLTSPKHHPPSSFPYLPLINCVQKAPLLVAYHQLHLHKSSLFNRDKCWIPNPPLHFSKMLISLWISLICWDFYFVFKPGFVSHILFWFFFLFLGMYLLKCS